MPLGSCTTQWSPYDNPSANIPRDQDELASTPRRSDASSNEAPTTPKALTSSLVPLPAKNFFTKFMKVFIETTQA